jgi:HTH-type transcriptional regulator/antitoxin MqsA
MNMNTKKDVCPLCEEGHLEPRHRSEKIKLSTGNHVHIDFQYSICDVCESEITTPKQAKENQSHVRDAQRAAEGLLTSLEIKQIRARLGLSQSDASLLFGGGTNAFSKYERGEVIQSKSMDRLIRVTSEDPAVLQKLKDYEVSRKSITNKRVRFTSEEIISNEEYLEKPRGKPIATIESFKKRKSANQEHNAHWQNDPQNIPILSQ